MLLHPVFVHFPIALLTVYAVFELVRWKRLTTWEPWFYIKAVLVCAGWLSSLAAFGTGLLIKQQFSTGAHMTSVIQAHQYGAFATMIIFGVLAAAYAWASYKRLVRKYAGASHALLRGPIVVPLALAGLLAVTVTGALGGGMVYGPDVDPMVHWTYQLLGL